jgi:hypothetical protein
VRTPASGQVGAMTAEAGGPEPPEIHQLKNYLSVIIGFCDLLLGDLPMDDPSRVDIQEMRKAGQAALDTLPGLATRMRWP